ncbi:MAG TPA: YrdB family protein [Leadbetterella sp.]|nr:YrdB family protein [Leadbetterella sp.]
MQIIKIINQTIAFALELAMLATMGHWGYLQGKSTWSKYGIAAVLVLIAILLWGYFAAPKSANRLSLGYRIIFEFVLFMIATFMLHKSGNTNYAIAFGIIATVNLSLEYYFAQ